MKRREFFSKSLKENVILTIVVGSRTGRGSIFHTIKEIYMNSLKIKDLINIGIFFVIYFVVFFAIGFIGLVPILFLFYPFVAAIIVGPIVM